MVPKKTKQAGIESCNFQGGDSHMMTTQFSSKLLALAMFAGAALFSGAARAEGACPPGSYPIGGQGVQGCAPIPASGSQADGPRATGRWIKTWGAFALSPNGESGAANGRRSKGAAEKDAVALCSQSGGKNCKAAFSYKNQCAVAAVPTSGKGGTSFARSATQDESKRIALNQCQTGGGIGCQVIYSACTEPEFEAF